MFGSGLPYVLGALPKTKTYNSDEKFSFTYKGDSNLDSHIRWMDYLRSNAFHDGVKKRINRKVNQNELVKITRQIIKTEIYGAYTPESYNRTLNLLRNFKVSESDNKMGGLSVYSDPQVATAKSGKMRGSASYAAFFEKTEFLSFIAGSGDESTLPLTHEMKYRPFFDLLSKEVHEAAQAQVHEAVWKEIIHRRPKDKANAGN